MSDDGAPAPKSTVLVVEDNDPLRDLVTTVLSRRGYHVLSASNAGEGLGVAAGHRECIDLLLTDVVMPGGSGTQLAEELLRDRGHMRVMFMSGYAETTLVSQLNGDTAPLAKPFTVEELLDAVESALEVRPAARTGVEGAAPESGA